MRSTSEAGLGGRARRGKVRVGEAGAGREAERRFLEGWKKCLAGLASGGVGAPSRGKVPKVQARAPVKAPAAPCSSQIQQGRELQDKAPGDESLVQADVPLA